MATNKQGTRLLNFQTALQTPNILTDIVMVDGNLDEVRRFYEDNHAGIESSRRRHRMAWRKKSTEGRRGIQFKNLNRCGFRKDASSARRFHCLFAVLLCEHGKASRACCVTRMQA